MPYRAAFFTMAAVTVLTQLGSLSLLVVDHGRLSSELNRSNLARTAALAERDHYEKSYRDLLPRVGPAPHRPTGSAGAVGNVGSAGK